MNLQAFGISALECLQSQNLSHPENRLSLKALAIVHGRQTKASVVGYLLPPGGKDCVAEDSNAAA
jgi:hypothetical protein